MKTAPWFDIRGYVLRIRSDRIRLPHVTRYAVSGGSIQLRDVSGQAYDVVCPDPEGMPWGTGALELAAALDDYFAHE